MRKITMTDGPLAGKSFLVPDDTVELRHHAAPHGYYVVENNLGSFRGEVTVDIFPDTSALKEALANLEPSGLEEFLPVGLPRVLAEARMGRAVLVVAPRQKDAEEAFGTIAGMVTDKDLARIVRTHGRSRIDLPGGGSIVPVGVKTTRVRGRSADTLFVLAGLTDADLEPVMPALTGSAQPRVILHEGAE
ncbi:hypothetical protein [Microbacterium caowuchunii]|uniref:Uncharacterized protein n=1 Tax=Microbacterium caowuchunii TaxID=2614638 RepID=A0A5N0TI18_9MICO|nr:hypothetical protein [Microbacterium caowuchunii]KAA9133747.1 hypothetical protein F6B40_08320 [Microbacterium caowuchunii]